MAVDAASPECFPSPEDSGLPRHTSTFIGRDRDIEAVMTMLAQDTIPLLTLLGPGGIGKTRLATEVAARMSRDDRLSVRWLSLENVTDHSMVEMLIAKALQVELPRGGDTVVHLARAVAGKDVLLVLDNLEHLPDAALTISRLLTHAGRMTLLATSRAPLDIRGEHRYPLSPLAILSDDRPPSPETLVRIESIRLFVDRARAVDPTFALTQQNAAITNTICRNLDGLPLAIELAAAQIAVLPPAALHERIASHQPLPLTGPRDAPGRLRTLHNAISWSQDLLSANGNTLFRRLGVFPGSFSLEAAEALDLALSRHGDEAQNTLGGITELVGHSLLRQEPSQGDARFSMLRTIRHFAHDRLVEAGESPVAEAAHARIYLDLAERMSWDWLVASRDEPNQLENDHPNLLAALAWYRQKGDAVRVIRLATALTGFWYAHTHDQIGFRWLIHAIEREDYAPPDVRGRLHISYGMLLGIAGDLPHAREWLASGLSLLERGTDTPMIVVARIWLGAIARSTGEFDLSEQALDEALQLAEEVESPTLRAALRARALSNLGVVANIRGDFALATERYEAALNVFKTHGPMPGMIRVLGDRGITACNQGDFESAMSWFRECLRFPGARTDRRLLISLLKWSALIAVEWQQPITAFRILGAAESMCSMIGDSDHDGDFDDVHARLLPVLESARRPALLNHARRTGREMSPTEIIAEVLSLQPSPSIEADETTRDAGLTGRELDVLRLLVAGKPNREIARELFLSVRTIESHVSHIYRKLGVQTRTSAVALALLRNLVTNDRRDVTS